MSCSVARTAAIWSGRRAGQRGFGGGCGKAYVQSGLFARCGGMACWVLVGVSQCLHIALTKRFLHAFVTDEGRVADNKGGLGPFRGPWFQVIPDLGAGLRVGHTLILQGMLHVAYAIPAGDQRARFIAAFHPGVPIQHGVAVFDVAEIAQDRFGR